MSSVSNEKAVKKAPFIRMKPLSSQIVGQVVLVGYEIKDRTDHASENAVSSIRVITILVPAIVAILIPALETFAEVVVILVKADIIRVIAKRTVLIGISTFIIKTPS